MNNQIVVTKRHWEMLTESLYQTRELESALYAFYKESTTATSHKILLKELLIPDQADYYIRTASRVAFKSEFTNTALQYCHKNRYSLIDIHTHPWSSDVNFSSIDDNEALHTKIPYLKKYLNETKISFIVLGKEPHIAQARMWNTDSDRLESIYKIVII